MTETARWGVYAPQATRNYQTAAELGANPKDASLARLHARFGPLHLVKPKKQKQRKPLNMRIKLTLLDAVIICLLGIGALHLVKAGEIAFWTGYEAQAAKGYK